MGCGCDKRAKKMLEVADKHEVKVPKKVRSFLERKASTAGPSPADLTRGGDEVTHRQTRK
jgi:hypothetical protein